MKKKIFALVLCCCLVWVSLGLTACNEDNGYTTVRLNEVTHSVFYAPLYVAINKGYFEEYGMEIELTNGAGSDNTMTALISGSADIGLMGPETTVYCNVQGMNNYPVIFGQLTKRDGSFLLSKQDEADTFEWSDLENKHVLIGRQGGMPAMTMQYIMNMHGLYDGVNCTMNDSVEFALMGSVFDADDTVDYTTLFEPTASLYQNEGKGYIVDSVGSESGEVPFTAFTALNDYLTKNPDTAKNFLLAVNKGYEYMCNNDPEVVAEALAPSFEDTSLESLTYVVESYVDIDAWCSSPVMTEDAYDRLIAIMKNAGELDQDVAFEDIVDNTIATEVANL